MDSGHNVLWMATAGVEPLSPLGEDARVEVCIVGAGIAGLSTAYLLAREGRAVMVLDHGHVGGGETGRTTAHLSNAMDDGFTRLERMHGKDRARKIQESHFAAIERIERIVAEEDIACDFERLDGFLFDPPGARRRHVPKEFEAARRLGVDCELVDRAPMVDFDTGQAVRFFRQGTFHPLKYLRGLEAAIRREGGRIHTGTHVVNVEGGRPCKVHTRDGFVVTCDHVVVATNAPINERIGVHAKQAPYRTYAIAAKVPAGTVHRALYWDSVDPYHYVRLHAEETLEPGVARAAELLIVGGEDHKSGEHEGPERHFRRLEEWARLRFPTMGEVAYRWSGMVFEPVDSIAFIGHNAGDAHNVWIVTGDSGQGMTHGTIAGMLLTDLIAGRKNPWAEVYDPSRLRVSLPAAMEAMREGASMVGHYAQLLGGGDVPNAGAIPPGEGAVLSRGGEKVACYRDLDGTLHERSAICTHLGCAVAWNGSEKRWECPCHGSRFDRYGKVQNGPAMEDLAPIQAKIPEPAK